MKKFASFIGSGLSLLVMLLVAAFAKQLGLVAVAICLPLLIVLVLLTGRKLVNRGIWRIWIVLSLVWTIVAVGLTLRSNTYQSLAQVQECPSRLHQIKAKQTAYDDALKALQPWERYQVTDILVGDKASNSQHTEAAQRVASLFPQTDSVDFWCMNTVGGDDKSYFFGIVIGLFGLLLGPIASLALVLVAFGWIGAGFKQKL